MPTRPVPPRSRWKRLQEPLVKLTYAQAQVAHRHGLTIYAGPGSGLYASARHMQKRGGYLTYSMQRAAEQALALHDIEADD